VPRPSERHSCAMRHKLTREREPGLRGALLPSLRDADPLVRHLGPGSRLRSPGTRENGAHAAAEHAAPAHITPARAPSPHSRARHRRSCRPSPRALARARRPSGRRDPPRTTPRPAFPRDA